MGQANSIHVQLERDSYLPGETVRGSVHVRLVECLDCNGIKLKAIGETRSKWNEHHFDGQVHIVQPFSGKELLVKGEHMLAEKGVIQPGMYSYPFEFSLPETVPASMDWDQASGYKSVLGCDGRARTSYFVQAIGMKTGTLSRDIKSEPLPFTVFNPNTVTPSGMIHHDDE
uniref:Arrestin-like N-terminal domain-containing protein n=1 Tax=Dunaliella tertiolecta TaxID=3047 RepID=A0A7S3R830_DUNTE